MLNVILTPATLAVFSCPRTVLEVLEIFFLPLAELVFKIDISLRSDRFLSWLRQRFTLIEKGKMQLRKTGEIKFANYNHDFVKNCDAVGVEY